MAWKELKILTTVIYAEWVSELLEAHGALSVTFLDCNKDDIFEPLPGEIRLWQKTAVIGLYHEYTDLNALLNYLHQNRDTNIYTEHTITLIAEKNWVQENLKQFKPMQFGKRLKIVPSWLTSYHDKNMTYITLDPGLAFGTGSHPSTALCLEWLENSILVDKRIVDFGCGSGILAIAALKLGASLAIGIDIDEQALTATKTNAERNGIDSSLILHQNSTALTAEIGTIDIVIANILARPLCQLANLLVDLLAPGGKLCLSGILRKDLSEVLDVYQSMGRLKEFNMMYREEWVAVSAIIKRR